MDLKMKKIIHFILIALLAVFFSSSGCDWADDEEEDEEQYSFKVMASNGEATGYYSPNGGSFHYFDTSYSGSSIYFSYERSISSLDSILVHAEGEDPATTAISIYLYEDSDLIDSASVYQIDGETVNVNLDYTSSE